MIVIFERLCVSIDSTYFTAKLKMLINFQVQSPNLVVPDCTIGKKPWKLINVPLAVPHLNVLREKFSELTRAEPHLGLNPQAPSLEDPSMTLAAERYALGLKVLTANHAPLSQEFLKKGCPHSLRGDFCS